MSIIKVDTIATRTGSGNITLSNSLASATIAGDLTVNGNDISTAGSMVLKPAGTEIVNINNTGDVIVKGQGSNRGMLTLRAGSNTSNSQLRFGDQASDTTGRIMYDHSDNTMRFQTNGSERVRISAAGLAIGGTGAANTLDDYEEGTFTPNVYGAGSNNSTWTTKTGEYTKIGNTVTCQIRIDHGNSGSANGDLTISGLPFAPAQANGTMSIGIWGANPSSQVGNVFGGSLPTLFKGGSNVQTQITFFTATLVYKTS